MILLEASLTGVTLTGDAVSEEVRQLFAAAGMECLSISAAMFFYSQDSVKSQEAIQFLKQNDLTHTVDIFNQKDNDWPSWITHLVLAVSYLAKSINIFHQAQQIESITLVEDIIKQLISMAELNVLALQDQQAAARVVAANLQDWINAHSAFGVVHYSILSQALAGTLRLKAGDPADVEGAELLISTAYELLDSTDEVNAVRRNSERFADILMAAHLTLPMYTTAHTLLNWANNRLRKAGQQPTDDLIKEIGVSEECRVACIETITQAGGNQIGQIMTTVGLLSKPGQDLREKLLYGIREASARIPHYPLRLRAAWFELAHSSEVLALYPYSSQVQMKLLGYITHTIQQRFAEVFIDTYTVNAAIAGPMNGLLVYLPFYTPPDESQSQPQPLSFTKDELSSEMQAAMAAGHHARSQSDIPTAITAYEAAYNLNHGSESVLAALLLAEIHFEAGDVSRAKPLLQAVIDSKHAEYVPSAAARLGTLLAEDDPLTAEHNLQIAIDSGDGEYSINATLNLGLLLYRRGELDRAELLFRIAMEARHLEWSAPAAYLLGQLKLDQGDLETAASAFQASLNFEYAPWSFRAALGLGIVRYRQNNYNEATDALQKAMAADDLDVIEKAREYLGLISEIGVENSE